MAVSNNLGMYLPTRDDYISVKRDISDNLAIIDAAVGNMDIIVNGNTASVNVTSGQFVTVLNSTITGVTDGIYKAVANVAAGVPFVAADLTSPTSGALNELVEQIGTLNGNKTDYVKCTNQTTGTTKARILAMLAELHSLAGNNNKTFVFQCAMTSIGVANGVFAREKDIVGGSYFHFSLGSKLYCGDYNGSSNYHIYEFTGTSL